jgi:hypothetical protein
VLGCSYKKIYAFLGNIFYTKRNRYRLLQIHFGSGELGSGIIFSPIRIRIRFLLKVSDPTRSGPAYCDQICIFTYCRIQFSTSPFRKINLLLAVIIIHHLSTSECRKRELVLYRTCFESTNFCLSKTGPISENSPVLFNNFNFICKFDHFLLPTKQHTNLADPNI